MLNPESSYINRIDQERRREDNYGPMAEKAVFSLFNSLPEMKARMATEQEDQGQLDPESTRAIGGFQSGKAIDVIAYREGRPAIAIQVTANVDEKKRLKKIQEIKEQPFLRLKEMTAQDHAIPRALVWLAPKQVEAFTKDPDFQHQQDVALQILNSVELSLVFDLHQTQSPKEQARLQQLIELVQTEKQKIKSAPQELAA